MMSQEEQRARADLESEIEREIEEELKDGICHLALGLHRLYLKSKKKISYSNIKEIRKSDETNEVSTVVCITTRTVGERMMQVYESQTRVLATKPSTDDHHKQDVRHGMGSQGNKRSAGQRPFKNKQLELGWKY